MLRFTSLSILAVVIVGHIGLAKPSPRQDEQAEPPITAANAKHVASIQELKKAASRIVPGPVRGQLTFVRWMQSIEIVGERDFRPLRTVAVGYKPMYFAASKNGRLHAWLENDTRVVIEETLGGKQLEIDTENLRPWTAFSPDSKLIATGGVGTQAKIWDTSGNMLRTLSVGENGGLVPVFSPDGKLLAIGNNKHTTRIFDVASGDLVRTLERESSHELAFSPDGKKLAVAYLDGSVGVWSVATGELLRLKATGNTELNCLDWNPAGDVLATAGRGGKITLWHPDTLTPLKELVSPAWVIVVRFSLDGSRLFSSGGSTPVSDDQAVTIWATH
jgi:WD40 repeat protein